MTDFEITDEMVEKAAAAIGNISLFSRFNDWTSDRVAGLPIEICRINNAHSMAGEAVVVARFKSEVGEEYALYSTIAIERARAALSAVLPDAIAQARKDALEEAAAFFDGDRLPWHESAAIVLRIYAARAAGGEK